MQIDRQETRQYLEGFDFENLFTQLLGWNYHTQTLTVTVGETEYQLTAIAEKRGMVVLECPVPETDGLIRDYAARCKIQRQVARSIHEHFIIYTDAEKTMQIWQCVKRERGNLSHVLSIVITATNNLANPSFKSCKASFLPLKRKKNSRSLM